METALSGRAAAPVAPAGGGVALFADDAEFTVAPGTFRGKDEIRKLLDWDVRLSPTASVRD